MKKVHFIGIGGIGMSAIAYLYAKAGWSVSGSDHTDNANLDRLRKLGVQVFIGHSQKHIKVDTDFVITSTAISKENPEFIEAQKNSIVLKRAQGLAAILPKENSVLVAGSHGKTTCSAYLSEILINIQQEPSFCIGGVLKKINSNALSGSGAFVIEADESDSSFHYFETEYGIITNIDNDHIDYYGSFEKLVNGFEVLVDEKIKFPILNIDDPKLLDMAKKIPKAISYGQSDSAKYQFEIIKSQFGQSVICLNGKEYQTNITGQYNLSNLVGALSYLSEIGLISEVKDRDLQLEGVRRRYDILYKKEELVVIDDYAHHPTEIDSLLKAIREDYLNYKLDVYFEPHRYTRTQNFWNDFARVLSLADTLTLLPIYAASEDEIVGVSSQELFTSIKLNQKKLLKSRDEIRSCLNLEQKKTVIVCLGAGPISSVFRSILGSDSI